MTLSSDHVLVYKPGRRPQQTIKRHYLKWRGEQAPPIPERCDNPQCTFHLNPLEWNGKPLILILDHKNGVNGDNRPKNLQLLCPKCNSQQASQGGGNKGRNRQNEGGFALRDSNGKNHYILPAEPGRYDLRMTNK